MKIIDWIPKKFRNEKYIRFAKYVLSGTITVLIEIALFSVLYYLLLFDMEETMRIHTANFIARVASSIVNYR
jgi:putative flippase GtrA